MVLRQIVWNTNGEVRSQVVAVFLVSGIVILFNSRAAAASVAYPEGAYFVRDDASLIGPQFEQEIEAVCAALYNDSKTPIIVVTLNSMSEVSGGRRSIESLTRQTFERWGASRDFAYSEDWSRGMLLLVAYGDRKARIELGRVWRGKGDNFCEYLMADEIVPRFKREEFAAGILAGVRGLDQLARGNAPKTLSPTTDTAGRIIFGIPFFVLITVVCFVLRSNSRSQRFRRGSSGWGYFGGASGIDGIGGSGYGGGGGFGGGGGATGSW